MNNSWLRGFFCQLSHW